MRRIFVTGIGTEVGKTVVSAVLVEALRADYFKPIQCGDLDNSDSMKVRGLISNTQSVVHKEYHRLKGFKSPHAAAQEEALEIAVEAFELPDTNNTLIIEGAGGLMAPLNDHEMVVDLIAHFDAETVLVSKNYLGSINHTLLSVELLRARGLKITGIIFNGESVPATEEVVLAYSGLKLLGRINNETEINNKVISEYAKKFTKI
ncbi:MAG: dethiobiotin synthase [Flavobacteriales bacterium]|nr:dethiobiotin synthase [Flavobacteriales bacterium]